MRLHVPPEAVFISSEGRPYLREYHCNGCGGMVCRITGDVIMSADNIGIPPSMGGHFVEAVCHVSSCLKVFRLFTVPPPIESFVPVITVNGVPI